MKKKSKFLVFILSPVPGLSHLYLGWTQRAAIFFVVFLGLCVGALSISGLGYNMGGVIGPLAFFAVALVWFIALAEALSLAGRNPAGQGQTSEAETGGNNGFLFISNHKIIALAFSAIPGAGHMFLGLLKPGAQLMAVFFLLLFLSDWLNLSLLVFIVPVIWFYSVFDIYHRLEDEVEVPWDASTFFDWFSDHPNWVGWGLIVLGLVVLLQRMVGPMLETFLSNHMRNCIETIFVSLVLIGGGIKLLLGNKAPEIQPSEEADS